MGKTFWLEELYKYISPPILEKFLGEQEESKSDKFVIVYPCIKLEYTNTFSFSPSVPAYFNALNPSF